jgi:hypothetical protein
LNSSDSRKAPWKVWGREQHPLPSVFSLILVFSSDVATSNAWRACGTRTERARGGVRETGDGVVVEEAGNGEA